jgi:hypothetical protein
VIETKTLPKEAPVEYVTKCPTELPKLMITEEQWLELSPESQWEYITNNVGGSWGKEYFTCATRHNTFVDWYLTDDLDE